MTIFRLTSGMLTDSEQASPRGLRNSASTKSAAPPVPLLASSKVRRLMHSKFELQNLSELLLA